MVIESDVNKLDKWSKNNQMKFSKEKEVVQHSGQNDHMHKDRLGNNWLIQWGPTFLIGLFDNYRSRKHDLQKKVRRTGIT